VKGLKKVNTKLEDYFVLNPDVIGEYPNKHFDMQGILHCDSITHVFVKSFNKRNQNKNKVGNYKMSSLNQGIYSQTAVYNVRRTISFGDL
jgi:hypothetical protein